MNSSVLFVARCTPTGELKKSYLRGLVGDLYENGLVIDVYDPKQMKLYDYRGEYIRSLGAPALAPTIVKRAMCLRRVLREYAQAGKWVHMFHLRYELLLSGYRLGDTKRYICTLYGGDHYTNPVKPLCRPIFRKFGVITAQKEELLSSFDAYYSARARGQDLRVLDMPLYQLRHYRRAASGRLREGGETRQSDLVTVVVGTNASPNEQHELIFTAIKMLGEQEREKLHLVIPLTYDGPKERRRRIVNEAGSLGVAKVTPLLQYLTDEALAEIRLAADVFVNFRKSDQMNVAVYESIYSGAIIINGSWLDYRHLPSDREMIMQASDIAGLRESLSRAISSVSRGAPGYRTEDLETVGERTLPHKVLPRWLALYGN